MVLSLTGGECEVAGVCVWGGRWRIRCRVRGGGLAAVTDGSGEIGILCGRG